MKNNKYELTQESVIAWNGEKLFRIKAKIVKLGDE